MKLAEYRKFVGDDEVVLMIDDSFAIHRIAINTVAAELMQADGVEDEDEVVHEEVVRIPAAILSGDAKNIPASMTAGFSNQEVVNLLDEAYKRLIDIRRQHTRPPS